MMTRQATPNKQPFFKRSAKERQEEYDRVFNLLFIGLTFPGIVVHECAHRLFCDLARVPVYEVRYLRFDELPGYVKHGPITRPRDAFFIAYGPLLLNSLLCMLLSLPAMAPYFILVAEQPDFILSILLWAGLAIGFHAMPSEIDTASFVADVARQKNKFWLHLFALSLYWLTRMGRSFWPRLIFTGLISITLPAQLLRCWAWLMR